MSTYGELVAEVLEIVPQPHREDLIRTKLNQAIRYISTTGFFWRDILETTIGSTDGVEALEYIQSIPITTAIRQMIYVEYPAFEDKIQCVNLEALKKRRQCASLQNVAYLSGTSLHIKNSKLTDSFNIAYYTNPDNFVTDGTADAESNWITELAPGLVAEVTASYVLNLIGDTKDAKMIGDLAGAMRATYIRDFVASVQG